MGWIVLAERRTENGEAGRASSVHSRFFIPRSQSCCPGLFSSNQGSFAGAHRGRQEPDHTALDDNLELNRANLNDIIRIERGLLTRINTIPIHESPVGAVQVFDNQTPSFKGDQGVLPR